MMKCFVCRNPTHDINEISQDWHYPCCNKHTEEAKIDAFISQSSHIYNQANQRSGVKVEYK